MTERARRLSTNASSTFSILSCIRTMSVCSSAASEPRAPMPMDTSAAVRLGASFHVPAVASGRCVFGMISSVTGQLWVKEGRESQRRLRFTLHFLPLAGRIDPFAALLHEASMLVGHYPDNQ